MESNIGVVYVCHASDADIAGFADKPVMSQWQLIKMPTAPLLHLTLVVLDAPIAPYQFESFLNVAAEDQANVLAQLANQDRLYLAFYGDDLTYRFTKVIDHNAQQRQQLDELVTWALDYWNAIAAAERVYGRLMMPFAKLNGCM